MRVVKGRAPLAERTRLPALRRRAGRRLEGAAAPPPRAALPLPGRRVRGPRSSAGCRLRPRCGSPGPWRRRRGRKSSMRTVTAPSGTCASWTKACGGKGRPAGGAAWAARRTPHLSAELTRPRRLSPDVRATSAPSSPLCWVSSLSWSLFLCSPGSGWPPRVLSCPVPAAASPALAPSGGRGTRLDRPSRARPQLPPPPSVFLFCRARSFIHSFIRTLPERAERHPV